MRKKIVAGNWKMNLEWDESIHLAIELNALLDKEVVRHIKVIIAPSFPFIHEIRRLTKENPFIHIAAQNCSSESKGAYTGEVSAPMLRTAGAGFVIIGHSERRAIFKETSAFIAKKIDAALTASLRPVFCCGETLNERNANRHFNVIEKQLQECLFHLSVNEMEKIIVAYEPVWAIGTGINASPTQAQEMHAFIRNSIAEKYHHILSDELSILYGGSCNANNAKELFAKPDIDGGLIGGASLNASEFVEIISNLAGM